MVGGKQEKKANGKKAFKSFGKKDAKPKSLQDLKKKITGKGFKPKGDKKHGVKDKKGGFKRKPAGDAAPLSKNAAKAASQPNYSHKPYSKLVEQMKTHWNKLREHSTPQEIKNNIVKEMIKAMSQHVMDITLRHDAARIVQAIIQFGNVTQQDAIIAEIQPKMGDVAKTPYGHFVILKAMNYCNQKPQMKKIAQALQGSFVSLGTHVIGARVVETILQLYPSQISRSLKSEFYGKKFTILMPEPPRNLHELLTALPNKSAAILDHMRDLALKFIQKGLISFVYTHHLLWEYVQELALAAATPAVTSTTEEGAAIVNNKGNNRINELVNALAEAGPKLLSTKPGAKVMTFVITHSTAKDRKRIIKSLKGHVLESLVHESAYLGILRLLDVVDDTVNVHKSFFDELKATERTVQYAANGDILGHKDPAWLQICLHHNAHKLVLRLLTPHQRHLETDESAVLDVKSPYSKKDDDLRRKEHIVYIKPVLLKVCAMYASDLVRSRFGSKVLQAIYETFAPEQLVESLANVYADQFVEVVVEDGKRATATQSNQDEDSDDEEEEEEGDDEEDVLPDEFDGEDEDEEDDEDDEDAEVVENDTEYQTLLAEAAKDNQQQKTSSANSNVQTTKKELLPIEEDACAHVLLKKLLQFETALILSKQSEDNNKVLRVLRQYQTDDQAQHNSHNNTTNYSSSEQFSTQLEVQVSGLLLTPPGLAQRLVALLEVHTTVFQRYVQCNRGCFALHVLFQLPGLFEQMQSLVTRLQGGAFTAETVSQQEGGKLLLKLQSANNALHSTTVENNTKAAPKTAEKKNTKKAAAVLEEPAVVEEEPVAPTSAVKKGRTKSIQSDTLVAVGKRSRANTEDEDNDNKNNQAVESISDTESVASSTASATRRSSRRLAAASTTTEPAEIVAPSTAQKNKRARLAAVVEEEEEVEVAIPEKTRGRKSIAPVEVEAPKSAKKTPAKRGNKDAVMDQDEVEENDVEEDAPKRSARGRKSTSAK